MIEVAKFNNKDDPRKMCREPFLVDDLSVATNGHILISWPCSDAPDTCSEAIKKNTRKMLEEFNSTILEPMPETTLPEKITCSWCKGARKAQWKSCVDCDGDGSCYTCGSECTVCDGEGKIIVGGGDDDCPECNGRGHKYPRRESVKICGVLINPNYLALISDESDLMVAQSPSKDALMFETGKYKGLIMGMRDGKPRHRNCG